MGSEVTWFLSRKSSHLVITGNKSQFISRVGQIEDNHYKKWWKTLYVVFRYLCKPGPRLSLSRLWLLFLYWGGCGLPADLVHITVVSFIVDWGHYNLPTPFIFQAVFWKHIKWYTIQVSKFFMEGRCSFMKIKVVYSVHDIHFDKFL